jgi:GNAT superfamily N-acetyltransferase
MKSKSDLAAELDALGFSPKQVVKVDIANPDHLAVLADMDTKRHIEKPQPGDCLNPWGNTYIVSTREGKPVGFLALRVTNDGYLGVDAIYLLPEFRGQGYGYMLILISQYAARLQRLPLVALQPLTSAGRTFMERAGIPIKPIDPMEASSLQSFADHHWQQVIDVTPCKHRHPRSKRPACERCVYRFAYPNKRRVLEAISQQIKLRTGFGTAA